MHIQAPHARGNLSILLNAICVACKFVDSAVRKVGSGEPPFLQHLHNYVLNCGII